MQGGPRHCILHIEVAECIALLRVSAPVWRVCVIWGTSVYMQVSWLYSTVICVILAECILQFCERAQ